MSRARKFRQIVNDTVGGVPLTVTFCPLCNTAIAFERTVDGRVLDFGTTGRLRYSNLIQYLCRKAQKRLRVCVLGTGP